MEINPFIEIGYKAPQYFCDREEETKQLQSYIANKINTTLFAFRKLGKTGLIQHVFYSLRKKKNLVCIYVDILGTSDKASFINELATAIYNVFPAEDTIGKKVIKAIQSLRPTIQFDELTGQPSVTIDSSSSHQQETTITGLFSFLDQQKIRVVFAIDEFQQILKYPEKNMEAILRTQMQKSINTTFIFCGSNQTMMHEIFNDAKRPFFASCTNLYLAHIVQQKYAEFISKTFNKFDRIITDEAIDFICQWTMLHTYYTQYFCNYLYAKNIHKIEVSDVQNAGAEILKLQEGKFYQYRNLLTTGQWHMLLAIGKEERLYQPNAKSFMMSNGLTSTSIINRGITALLTKEMILHNISVERPYYEVYDKFLMRWIQNRY